MLDEDASRPGEMYTACCDSGVYRPYNSGLTWTPVDDLYIDQINYVLSKCATVRMSTVNPL